MKAFIFLIFLSCSLAQGAAKVTTPSIVDGAVTNAKMANMSQGTIKGRASAAGTGAPVDLTAAQAKTALAIACSDVTNASASCSTDATNASNISSGTLPAARLPDPTISTKGGIIADTCLSSNFVTAITTSAGITCSQPAFTNISGSVAASQMPALTGDVTTSAGAVATTIGAGKVTNSMLAGSIDLTSKVTGLLPLANGGLNANLSATGGTSQFLKQASSGAAITVGRPACSDLSDSAASCATDATNASNISSGTLPAARLAGATTSAISSTDIDWSTLYKTGGLYTKTLGANTTFTFSNKTAGQTIVIRLTNTASNYTVTWPTIKWPAGTTPTETIGAKSDIITCIYDGTDVFCSSVQNL
jgi:hypothetical protein